MTINVTLIADHNITSSSFSTATEQGDPYIQQPAPDADNVGSLRPLATGEVSNFSYESTITTGGTFATIYDSTLKIFGNDYFIGGSASWTSGNNDYGSALITDFVSSTGALILASSSSATMLAGDSYTLTVNSSKRTFEIEEINSGDVGDATFKWNHDGSTWLGRKKPYSPTNSSWIGTQTFTYGNYQRHFIINALNGNWVRLYTIAADDSYSQISTDEGLNWSDPVALSWGNYTIYDVLLLDTGRIYVSIENLSHAWSDAAGYYAYSDNNGESFSSLKTVSCPDTNFIGNITQLSNRNVYSVHCELTTGSLYGRVSTDLGATFGSKILIAASNSTINYWEPSVVQAKNGDVVVAFVTDNETNHQYKMKSMISTDYGRTYGSPATIFNYSSGSWRETSIVKDIDGTLYCAAREGATSPYNVNLNYSTTNGASWGTGVEIVPDFVRLDSPVLNILDGHLLVLTFLDNAVIDPNHRMVRSGIWETYSNNACPFAIDTKKQKLICDTSIFSYGGAGSEGDAWSFSVDYGFPATNLISDSPTTSWRSQQDNLDCYITLDMGNYSGLYADSISLYGVNLASCSIQMSETASFATLTTDESINFKIDSGTVASITKNILETTLGSKWKNHELVKKPYYIRFTSGSEDNSVFKIKDNIGDYWYLDTSADHNISASDSFDLFQDHMTKFFTADIKEYARIKISAHRTSDDYYEIGTMVLGGKTQLSRTYVNTYGRDHVYDIQTLRTPGGQISQIKQGDTKRTFQLTWRNVDEARRELISTLDYLQGTNVSFIPRSASPASCYLCKLIGGVKQQHRMLDRYDISVTLEELT